MLRPLAGRLRFLVSGCEPLFVVQISPFFVCFAVKTGRAVWVECMFEGCFTFWFERRLRTLVHGSEGVGGAISVQKTEGAWAELPEFVDRPGYEDVVELV